MLQRIFTSLCFITYVCVKWRPLLGLYDWDCSCFFLFPFFSPKISSVLDDLLSSLVFVFLQSRDTANVMASPCQSSAASSANQRKRRWGQGNTDVTKTYLFDVETRDNVTSLRMHIQWPHDITNPHITNDIFQPSIIVKLMEKNLDITNVPSPLALRSYRSSTQWCTRVCFLIFWRLQMDMKGRYFCKFHRRLDCLLVNAFIYIANQTQQY